MRSVPEWKSDSPDAPVPLRVRLRVFERANGTCQDPDCARKIRPGDKWECDHIIALSNNGENRENNLQILCEHHYKKKNAIDAQRKAKIARIRERHLGLKKVRNPLPGSKTSPWRKTFNHGWVRR